MFGRIFYYKIKELMRSYWLIGWNFLFPLVLATAFYLGFGRMMADDPEFFHTIPVGYIVSEDVTEENAAFLDVLAELTKEREDDVAVLKTTEYDDREAAIAAMNANRISGIYIIGADIETIVAKNSISASTLNQIVRTYENHATTLINIAKDHPESLQKAMDLLSEENTYIKEHTFQRETSAYMQYFYALLAMTALFSSWISTVILEGICANKSESGKRFEVSGAGKLSSIGAGLLAGLLLQCLSNTVVICYIEYVLKLSFGMPIWCVMLVTTLGSGVGISVGCLMGSLIKNPALLVVVPLAFSMVCSFFSGLMWGNIKQILEYHCPIVNRINPAALVTDCLYIRSTYGATPMYYQNLVILAAITVGAMLLSSLILRRRNYVSL